MFAIKAIYDGTGFIPLEPIPVNGKYKVVITFIEPVGEPIKEDTALTDKPSKLPRSTAKGLWKDKVWMSDDFNEPLDEMKEYME